LVAESADRDIDDVAADAAHDLFAQSDLLDRARPEILHENVGGRDQLL